MFTGQATEVRKPEHSEISQREQISALKEVTFVLPNIKNTSNKKIDLTNNKQSQLIIYYVLFSALEPLTKSTWKMMIRLMCDPKKALENSTFEYVKTTTKPVVKYVSS